MRIRQLSALYVVFPSWILDVHEKLAARGNPAVHFDIHGYTLHNTDNWMELGYNLRGGELNRGLNWIYSFSFTTQIYTLKSSDCLIILATNSNLFFWV